MDSKVNGSLLPSVLALAYLGDARHSLYVRQMLVGRGLTKSGDLNRESLKYVTAESQARMCRTIMDELSEDERDVYRRASNSTHLNKPRHTSGADYRAATGFEAVIGMLTWLNREERVKYLLDLTHRDATDVERTIENDTEN